MRIRCLFAAAGFICSLINLEANSGVFRGAGASVIPQKQNHVRMSKEVINIKIDIPESSGKWGVPFIPQASLDCLFHFKNASTKAQKVLVGFPIVLGDDMPKKHDNIVKQLNFSALFNGTKNPVKYQKGLWDKKLDPKHLYKHVFTWTNSFPPQAESLLSVTYDMGLSVHALYGFEGLKSAGIGYVFPYITSTAYTWQSTPQSAEFSIDVRECRKKLKQILKSKVQIFPDANPLNKPLIFWISKADFHYKKGVFHKTFSSHDLPKDTVELSLIVLNLPASAGAMKKLIMQLKDKILSHDEQVKQKAIDFFYRLDALYSALSKGQADSNKLFDPFSKKTNLEYVWHFGGKKQKRTIAKIYQLISAHKKDFPFDEKRAALSPEDLFLETMVSSKKLHQK